MRWQRQRIDGEGSQQLALPGMPGLLRTVRAPEFAGVVFHEVAAKSVLNRVPPASRQPFEWTVNPYRGCSHSCVYCMSGDTPILMADGRTKPLAALQIGDAIYGTTDGRYAVTRVLAHWSVVKPAYRVTLEDGTQLVTSGDHRLLAESGWVPASRLDSGNRLMGTGRFVDPPKDSPEYRDGYLRGVIRRDWPGGRPQLATLEADAAERAQRYLAGARLGALTRWPDEPTADWHKGFLAGMFDADGRHAGGVLRINVEPQFLDWTAASLRSLGLAFRVEDREFPNGLICIRLLGGLAERLRFCHTVDPASTARRTIAGMAVPTSGRMDVTSVEALGLELPLFDITTGTGDFIADGVVSHNCFARNSHTYLDLDAGHDFDSQVVVKVNAPEVLARELSSPKWTHEHVAMGTNTDPYQRAEGRYRLMPGIITALARNDTPFSILTKGTLLARDIPLLASVADRVQVGIGVSIAMLDRELSRSAEPGTPSPQARLELVRKLTEAGLSCGVMVAPVLPGLTDSTSQLDALLGEIAAAGAAGATVLALHLRPGAREWYLAWLAREYPELVARYERIYARGSYADRRYRSWLARRVGPLLRKHGLYRKSNRDSDDAAGQAAAREPTSLAAEQLSLL